MILNFGVARKTVFLRKLINKDNDDDKKLNEAHLKLLREQESFEQKCQLQALIEDKKERKYFFKAAQMYAETQDLV